MRPGEFLNTLWKVPLVGAVPIWDKQRKSTTFVPLAELDSWSYEDDDELASSDFDLYTGPGLRRLGLESETTKKGGVPQGTKKDIVALAGFVLDVDCAWGIHAANAKKRLPSTDDEVDAILSVGPEPTLIVHSGGGVQPWYLFEKPWRLPDPAARTVADRAYKAFQAPFLAKAKELGFHLDSTATIQHVFRLPGTYNQKFRPAKRVEVIYQDGPRIAIPTSVKIVSARAPSPSSDDRLEAVRGWMKRVRPDHPHRQAIEAVLAGESFAAPGERNKTMYDVVSTIAWLTPARGLDPEELAELLRPSLAIWANEETAEKTLDEELEIAARMFESAIEGRVEKDVIKQRELAGIASGIGRVLRRNDAPVAVVHDADDTEADIDSILRCSVVQHKGAYFVFSFGEQERPLKPGYYGPFNKEDFLTQLKGCWENAPEDFALTYEAQNKKSGEYIEKDKTIPQILKEYAVGAHGIVGDIALQDSYFDLDTRIFNLAPCPFRVTEPKFDPMIDEWLRLLGGDMYDKLLDWIAVVPLVDRGVPALYLEGPPAVGKTNIFARGISRLWRTGGPAHYTNIASDYNGDMFKCPFILLDEGGDKRRQTSAFIRSLVGSSEHTFREKYIVAHKMLGCMRLVIAANNDRVLAQLSSEELGEDDIDAIAGRFLHIRADNQAAAWIKQANASDRGIIDSWIYDDLLAKHVIWLCENREVKEGERFRVDSVATDMHRALLVRGEKQELVLEWLARFMLKPEHVEMYYKTSKKTPLARVGNGQLLVNGQAIFDVPDFRSGLKDRLTPGSVGRILKLLSYVEQPQCRPGERGSYRPEYYNVNYDNVKQFAETLQMNVQAMEDNLMRECEWKPSPGPRRPKLKLVPMSEE